jgi:branched-chain amino acid transport system ATP-binding protein
VPDERPILELEGVVGGYGSTTVLRDVSLEVVPRSVVLLLGPNGAGKSTLLRLASGLLRPTRGRVLLEGADVTRLPAHARAQRGLCHIPEGRGIFPTLTVAENVALAAKRGAKAAAVERAVETFPALGDRLAKPAGVLSGGQQQMLSLARAFVGDPRLILVDEASLGLAPIVVDAIFASLAELARQGTALLIVEQYLDRALALADRVYLLDRGQVVFAGEPSQLERDRVAGAYLGTATTKES